VVGRTLVVLGATYLVIDQSPAVSRPTHERKRPGLNHLAFHAGSRSRVDEMSLAAVDFGWRLLFADRHPWAGGAPDVGSDGHYAAYLEDADGYEVELVAAATASSE
jgi:catechol 2,3-dioxygenase-like lactoylglutathione lyase family enzyme